MLLTIGLSALLALRAAAAAVPGNENAELKRAEGLVSNFRYEDALTTLGRAKAVRGNSRPTLLRILELQGVVAAQLKRTKVAQAAFRELLVLDPNYQLDREYNPRVMTPFYEAKRLVSEQGALNVRPGDATVGPTDVQALRVEIAADPLSLVRGVRFHVKAQGGDWREATVPVQGGRADTAAWSAEVSWWAEVLGDQEAVVAQIGDGTSPRVERAAQQPQAAPTPNNTPPAPLPPAPVVSASPEPAPAASQEVAQTKSPGTSGLRIAGYVLVVGAVAAAGGGAYFGWESQQELAQITGATRNAQNQITGLTEKQAYQLNDQTRQNAVLANTLFGAAGALAVTGALLWWVGAPVAVAPAPGGVTVTGTLP